MRRKKKEEHLGSLGYLGDGNPAELYGDYFINHDKDPS